MCCPHLEALYPVHTTPIPSGSWALMSTVTLLLSACTSWQPIAIETGAVPERVRVTTGSLERVELRNARLVGDTAIEGLSRGRTPRSIPLVDIQLLEQGQINSGRTVLLVLVWIPLGLFTVALACAGGIICGGL